MRQEWWILLLFSNVYFTVSLASVRNVRLVDHTSYAVSVLQKTMWKVEKRCWSNLKIDDMHFNISENVLSHAISAGIDFKDGFVVSIQKIDIIKNTIQQVWLTSGNTSTVEVRSTMRMIDVALGFDVTTEMDDKTSHSTGLIVYPELQFRFTIIKNLFTDGITVNVVGTPILTRDLLRFIPENVVTKVFTVLFEWNSIATSVERWATDIFRPITLELVTKEIKFPRICYDCSG